MKIKLEEPFASVWKHGYVYRSSRDSRQRICLVNDKTDRTFMAYARYLLAVKLGRILREDEEADHINEDCTDDREDNIQLLTKTEHIAKSSLTATTGRAMVELSCDYCGGTFQREKRKLSPKSKHFFCCRSCLWAAQRINE